MADTKISAFAAIDPLPGALALAGAYAGANYQVTVDEILDNAARADERLVVLGAASNLGRARGLAGQGINLYEDYLGGEIVVAPSSIRQLYDRSGFFDNFENIASNVSQGGKWTGQHAGTGAQQIQAAPPDRFADGVVQFDTGTTTTGRSGLLTNITSVWLGATQIAGTCRVRFPTLSDASQEYSFRFGLMDNNAGDQVDGVYFEYARATSTAWQFCTANNNSRTKTASSVTVAVDKWYTLEYLLDAGRGRARYWINGQYLGEITTNIPADSSARVTGFGSILLKSAGTTRRTCLLDFMGYDKLSRYLPQFNPAVDYDFARMAEAAALDAGITFTRSGSALALARTGLYESRATDTPRFWFDPVSKGALGLLMEKAATNVLVRSCEFDNASWVKSSANITVTANSGASLDGSNAADLITKTGSSDEYLYQTFTIADDEDWAGAFIIAPGSLKYARVGMNMILGGTTLSHFATVELSGLGRVVAVTSSAMTAKIWRDAGGYYRVAVSMTNNATGNTLGVLILWPGAAAADAGTIYAWHGQAENYYRCTSPIVTTTAAATRNAENCYASHTFALPSTMLLEWVSRYVPDGLRYVSIGYDSAALTSNFVAIAQGLASGTDLAFHVYSGAAETVVPTVIGSWSADRRYRATLRIEGSDWVARNNAGDPVDVTSGAAPVGMNRFSIGVRPDTVTGHLDDIICKAAVVANEIDPDLALAWARGTGIAA